MVEVGGSQQGAQQRTRFTGPALVRLLARLAQSDAPAPPRAFAPRLAEWLRWTDAVALSSALGAPAPAAAPAGPRPMAAAGAQAEFTRVRQLLARSIAEDTAAPPREALIAPEETGFAPFRRLHAAKQQAMEVGIVALRGRLREAVAARSPRHARLAAVDAVLEQALGPQERLLLWSVPSLLEKRFERLRAAQGATDDGGWMRGFCGELQAALLAELEIRLQPVEGLLESLRDE